MQALLILAVAALAVAAPPPNQYPIRAAFINRLVSWAPDQMAASLAVPGYAPPHNYNYIILAFWSCQKGAMDAVFPWIDPLTYFGAVNDFGNTTQEIQLALKKIYNDNNIRVLISAFGSTEFPTTAGIDPYTCGYSLGRFVRNNNLDGVNIDWEDNAAMNAGLGEGWLVAFTRAVRSVIPNHVVSHCPQAPYFKHEFYQNGAYKTINDEVGDLIDFYIVQFYNQGSSQYDTYNELFVSASGTPFNGTAVLEIANRGVPLRKIVVGKPVLTTDLYNTGFVAQSDLGSWALQAYQQYNWYGGIAHWQYASDPSSNAINQAAGPLIAACQQSGACL